MPWIPEEKAHEYINCRFRVLDRLLHHIRDTVSKIKTPEDKDILLINSKLEILMTLYNEFSRKI